MKITVSIDPKRLDAAFSLQRQMFGADGPCSLCLLPGELTPTEHPRAVKDLSRVAVFHGNHHVLFHAPENCWCRDGVYNSRADDIYCGTFKCLKVVHNRPRRPPGLTC